MKATRYPFHINPKSVYKCAKCWQPFANGALNKKRRSGVNRWLCVECCAAHPEHDHCSTCQFPLAPDPQHAGGDRKCVVHSVRSTWPQGNKSRKAAGLRVVQAFRDGHEPAKRDMELIGAQ